MEAYVKTAIHQGIGTIEFFHPQSNSLPAAILASLAKEIKRAGTNPEIKVIILRSAGDKTFCAGASFDELAAIETEKDGLNFFMGFANVINEMRKCPKLIIARIQGKCIGGGVGLAAAADYAIANTNCTVKLSELAVGIGPFVVGPVVERKIGASAFAQLAIDATSWRPADWARRKGLFAELHETTEMQEEYIQKLANSLAHSNPDAMASLKKVCWEGTENWDDLLAKRAAISGKLVLSSFTKNAIAQFKAGKRDG